MLGDSRQNPGFVIECVEDVILILKLAKVLSAMAISDRSCQFLQRQWVCQSFTMMW